MLKLHDKIVLKRPMGAFDNVGEICEVIDISGNCISFKFGNGMHFGCMSANEFSKYFERHDNKKTSITNEDIDAILKDAKIERTKIFDKCTLVSVKLKNGFVITESSACVDPANYDDRIGYECCMKAIRNKLWELEGYRLQCELAKSSIDNAEKVLT